MAKHLVDIDEVALDDAKRELGTGTIKDTVNLALRRASAQRRDDVNRGGSGDRRDRERSQRDTADAQPRGLHHHR